MLLTEKLSAPFKRIRISLDMMLPWNKGHDNKRMLRLCEYEKRLWAQTLTLAGFNASVLLLSMLFPCLFKQCVIYVTEDYYHKVRKQFSGSFSL